VNRVLASESKELHGKRVIGNFKAVSMSSVSHTFPVGSTKHLQLPSSTSRTAHSTLDHSPAPRAWADLPAPAEIEDALCPAFIIEELENGSFTVFVPSIPTPLAGAV
jgi:hypothetical protein